MTEFLHGTKEQISWVEETSYGSGGDLGADGEVVGTNARVEPNFNQSWQEILSAGTSERTVETHKKGPKNLPFTLTFNPVNWKFLKYFHYSVSDSGSDPYTHTFTLQDEPNSFKLEWARRKSGTDHVITLTGCFVIRGTIRFNKPTGEGGEGMIEVSLECQAQDESPGTSTTSISAITATPFQHRMAKLTLNGTERTELNNGRIVLDSGINPDDSRYANQTLNRNLGEPIPNVHRLSGRLNLNISDSTYYDFWSAASAISGTNKIEFIRDTDDDVIMTFDEIRLASPGAAPTNFDNATSLDVAWIATKFSSLVATDSISTY